MKSNLWEVQVREIKLMKPICVHSLTATCHGWHGQVHPPRSYTFRPESRSPPGCWGGTGPHHLWNTTPLTSTHIWLTCRWVRCKKHLCGYSILDMKEDTKHLCNMLPWPGGWQCGKTDLVQLALHTRTRGDLGYPSQLLGELSHMAGIAPHDLSNLTYQFGTLLELWKYINMNKNWQLGTGGVVPSQLLWKLRWKD